MISREEKKLLLDIIEAIDSIDNHLEKRRVLEEYLANKTKRRAVEREIEIIGEAMSKLLKINPNTAISYSRIIVDLRNKVIHAYDSVDDILIWKIIVKDIPMLREQANKLLNEN
jgi:uncharacterized protein with HEPN domain